MDILEIAKSVEFNAKAEAQAILDYTEFLNLVKKSELNEEEKVEITDIIAEIISDELNHEKKLHELYTALTGIETNKN